MAEHIDYLKEAVAGGCVEARHGDRPSLFKATRKKLCPCRRPYIFTNKMSLETYFTHFKFGYTCPRVLVTHMTKQLELK